MTSIVSTSAAQAPRAQGTQPPQAPTPPAATPAPTQAGRPGRQPLAKLRSAVAAALQVDPNARMTVDKTSNGVTFLAGEFKVETQPGVDDPTRERVAQGFLRQHGTLFGVNDPSNLRLVDNTSDTLGFQHLKYQQYAGDLPVFGQQLVVHTKGNVVKSVGGHITPNVAIDATPDLDVQTALRTLAARPGVTASSITPTGTPTLGIYTTAGGTPHLAYELDVRGTDADQAWRYYVDANTGRVLDHWSTVESALNRETYTANNSQSKPGKLVRREGDGPVADDVVNRAHDNAEAVYDYYHTLFGRDSIDGRGMKLLSTVHYGHRYNNAFWDGRSMTYGDGDGSRFTYFGNGKDVVGHEMAHGVTERSAGLRYFRQSGALNESWSDVFGNLIEKWEEHRQNPSGPERDPKWLIGEEIFTPGKDGDGLRSMSEPGTGYDGDPQPGHMRDYKNTMSDNGGVHINSGIPNKAAYEVAQTLGQEKLGRIWYRAVTNYLTPSSQFIDAANVTVQSAADLYGKDSAEVKAVQDAWTSVGLKPTVVPGIG